MTVFADDRKGRKPLFEGPRVRVGGGERKNIDLIHGKAHYNLIKTMIAAFSCNYYCRICHTPHRCTAECDRCRNTTPCDFSSASSSPSSSSIVRDFVNCKKCYRNFYGETGYENHLRPLRTGRSICDVVKICPSCNVVILLDKDGRNHKCGEVYCAICKKYMAVEHRCHMQPVKDDKKKKKEDRYGDRSVYVFYDIEFRQEQSLDRSDQIFRHTPNLLISSTSCGVCITSTPTSSLLPPSSPYCDCGFKHVTCIAHYANGNFIVSTILQHTTWKPEIIMSGSKILRITYDGPRFVDSLNFMPMPLRKLPAAFGLDDSMAKGYFPHFFNKKKSSDYGGPFPPPEMYSVDSMCSAEREGCETTPQDVRILRSACLRFREIFLSTTGGDHFRESVTIASACMRVFRKRFLKQDIIAITPPGGYRLADNQSRKALLWLLWEEKRRGTVIQHATNRREAPVMGKKVDGLAGNTVFQFHGCYFHGCVACFPDRTKRIANSPRETMGSRYEATTRKTDGLRVGGFKVVEKWECEFERETRETPELASFVASGPLPTESPINPRDAFFGGRTN
ncbi:hypothetical protein J437_LFUL018633 [Ladona fulva]|uniref:Uncharacterized protein n=1 Tax=Ladona fulva TaxID=123851 RepID=A0A8K0PAG5_LADFU|nr:hypothetical protein J437_LFUL018633 [Ladona fulva]